MAEQQQRAGERAMVSAAIADIAARMRVEATAAVIYQATAGSAIKHQFDYRTDAGRLQGFGDGALQKFSVALDADAEDGDVRVIETVLASAMQREEVFGGLHQYPRAFAVGPSQIEASSSSSATKALNLRDVDRVLWIERGAANGAGARTYLLVSVDLAHGASLVPGTVDYTWRAFSAGAERAEPEPGLSASQLRSALGRFFYDAASYTFNERQGAGTTGTLKHFGGSGPLAYLPLLWVAQELMLTRHVNVPKTIDAAAEGGAFMLASAVLGHAAFVTPQRADQRATTGPRGAITVDRLRMLIAPAAPERSAAGIDDDDDERAVAALYSTVDVSGSDDDDDDSSSGREEAGAREHGAFQPSDDDVV
jgi:hypothetical protein